MSWLFVAFIPWLLMVATFGLERLESGLVRDTVSASDVDEFLQQADSDDVGRLVRDGMGAAIAGMHRRQQNRLEPVETLPTRTAAADVPTRVYIPHRPNPQFQPVGPANRV
ncbi:hypothetical protein MDOR_33510 [Mycolicibacterium doricum]|uniref:Uncharacterized protein n=1 Tax=Mycolicibacterium doricum TaxID=126673 RepID=A0A1X1TIJ3_9MYCO|nr:hypothetical protein [Mycolicibacterium doricum]MCV7267955.1 hypothetical protein [Mycolicibacterium doricum]ORV44350.1 hypothetical protein AWC01_03480 [Mycolicibacterium doricum]BBZ09182.1 hypothetical protein MDOR_33510 [Mycolicibacterium doricum]